MKRLLSSSSCAGALLAVAGLALAAPTRADQPAKPWTLELETGLTTTRYNSARVPNSSGTNIDLAGLIGKSWRAFGRVTLLYQDRAGGTWKLLYAPYRVSGEGDLDQASSFAGEAFGPGRTEAFYQFDSYRVTYRKPWRNGWSVGGTLKVRDAEIRLEQGGTRASERNVGLVPLLHLHGEGLIGGGLMYEVELDGLAGGPGRAFDITARLKKPLTPDSTAFLGLRVLEGGADVPRVKNFAWITYVTAGVSFRF